MKHQWAIAFAVLTLSWKAAAGPSEVFVSNERSGNLTVIDGSDFTVLATIPVGKRPRGIHASPDGKTVYIALSGTPISAPPQLDANGNPILKKGGDDDDEGEADKAADGIGVVDVAQRRFLRKIKAGSDPEQFAVGPDGKLYIANEDVGTATVLDPSTDKIITFVPVGREPEGVGISPTGAFFYVTCETAGQVFAINMRDYKVIAQLKVAPRPRSVDFLADGSRAFIPSESAGLLNVVDCAAQKVIKSIVLPKGSRPMTVKVSPDGKKVYASGGRAGTVCVIDAVNDESLGTIKAGRRPWGIAISSDGKYMFVANGPSNDVSVIDLAAEKEIARVKAGGSPWGVVIVPFAGRKLTGGHDVDFLRGDAFDKAFFKGFCPQDGGAGQFQRAFV